MTNRITLKNMLAEGFYYDVGTEKNAFESSVATATEQAKKKFEESMKQKVLNQKVKVRASRGQPGQPEKDYVIEKVSSASIDWYWKQYVVVFKDEKGKEYFLKPGFKVEVLSQAATGKQTQQTPNEPAKKHAAQPKSQTAPQEPAKTPTGATAVTPQPAGQKNASVPPVRESENRTDTWKVSGKEPGEIYVLRDGDQMGGPFESEEEAKDWMYDKQQQLPEEKGSKDLPGTEYKKEWVAEMMSDIIFPYLSPEIQNKIHNHPTPHILKYVKSAKWVGRKPGDVDSANAAIWLLEVPVDDMAPDLDTRDLQLAISDGLRSNEGAGSGYSRSSASVDRIGRLYRIEVEYTTGLDV